MQYDPNESVSTPESDFANASGPGSIGSSSATTGATSDATSDATSIDTGISRPQPTGGKAREKASQLKATLADKLEQGAQKIRERTASYHKEGQPAAIGTPGELGESTSASTSARAEHKLDRASESLAHGMESTANWVRNADLDKMKGNVEQQVRANPGRALLLAVGVGYLLGKVLRGGRPRI